MKMTYNESKNVSTQIHLCETLKGTWGMDSSEDVPNHIPNVIHMDTPKNLLSWFHNVL